MHHHQIVDGNGTIQELRHIPLMYTFLLVHINFQIICATTQFVIGCQIEFQLFRQVKAVGGIVSGPSCIRTLFTILYHGTVEGDCSKYGRKPATVWQRVAVLNCIVALIDGHCECVARKSCTAPAYNFGSVLAVTFLNGAYYRSQRYGLYIAIIIGRSRAFITGA